jgi:SAM-dependent methyltransferase
MTTATTATATLEKSGTSALVRVLRLTLFVSAFLMFWCEPMVGKMVLPHAGGAAAVWTTCVLFFQVILLAAYLYAYLLGRLKSLRLQLVVHASVLLMAVPFLPIWFGTGLDEGSMRNPAIWLVAHLFTSVGVPFFAVATTAPLLQKWFSATSERSASDPYFLYAASNAGSVVALAMHPFVLEPLFGVSLQSQWWLWGYVMFVVMVGVAVMGIWKKSESRFRESESDFPQKTARPAAWNRLYWVAAAFLPSALMLAVTNHISTNLASAPFVWVIPLAIYLLTFILAFAERPAVSSIQISRTIPLLLLLMLFLPVVPALVTFQGIVWTLMGAHLMVLFFSALLCHTALAQRRPGPEHLTEFYFWIALGGVLGGAFTAVVAPMIFRTVFEYPLLLAMVAFFRQASQDSNDGKDHSAWAVPAAFGIFLALAFVVLRSFEISYQHGAFTAAGLMFAIAIYQLRNRPRPFAVALAAIILANAAILPRYNEGLQRLYAARNFFGVKMVLQDDAHQLRELVHGDTLHGVEKFSAGDSGQPLSYYHRTGPAGDVMRMLAARPSQRAGIIGLGAGSMAAYAGPGRSMTFFEIDPEMEGIARQYFTFLDRCGSNCRVVTGDGRLELERMPEGYFDFLMLDAFSSDSIPAHLMSREALKLYLSRLTPDGVLLFHVSNRYLDVARLVSALITDASLVGFIKRDEAGVLQNEGKASSIHVVAARRLEDLGSLPSLPGWMPVVRPQSVPVWTDDYSNLLGIIQIR